jgi:hypothetical protein
MAKKKVVWLDNEGNEYPSEADADEAIARSALWKRLNESVSTMHCEAAISEVVDILRYRPNELIALITANNPRWEDGVK